MFQHVGVILSAEGSDWLTADGGQGNGRQSGIMSRKFKPDGEIEGEQGKKAWVNGWLDLDCLHEFARSPFRTSANSWGRRFVTHGRS